jgi:hypothetical protein
VRPLHGFVQKTLPEAFWTSVSIVFWSPEPSPVRRKAMPRRFIWCKRACLAGEGFGGIKLASREDDTKSTVPVHRAKRPIACHEL